jgi:hypothetical protein
VKADTKEHQHREHPTLAFGYQPHELMLPQNQLGKIADVGRTHAVVIHGGSKTALHLEYIDRAVSHPNEITGTKSTL